MKAKYATQNNLESNPNEHEERRAMMNNEIRLEEAVFDPTPPGQASSPRRILVADDEAGMRVLLSEVLGDSGYHVDTAEDGAVAWAALQTKPYDLLITDHNMPNVTGEELIKKLRAARMGLPVVMVSGDFPQHEPAQNPPLQLAAKIMKPFVLAELVDTVTSLLRLPAAC